MSMGFQWLSTTQCPSCKVIPTEADYDEFGYPVCPVCETTIRSTSTDEEPAVVHAQTD